MATAGELERPREYGREKGSEDSCLRASRHWVCARQGPARLAPWAVLGQCILCFSDKEGPSSLASMVLCSTYLSHRGGPSWNSSEGQDFLGLRLAWNLLALDQAKPDWSRVTAGSRSSDKRRAISAPLVSQVTAGSPVQGAFLSPCLSSLSPAPWEPF